MSFFDFYQGNPNVSELQLPPRDAMLARSAGREDFLFGIF